MGVFLLLAFCIWGVHFTPDMTQPADEFQKAFGALTLCGGPICLLSCGDLIRYQLKGVLVSVVKELFTTDTTERSIMTIAILIIAAAAAMLAVAVVWMLVGRQDDKLFGKK